MWCFLAIYERTRSRMKYTRELQFFDTSIVNREAFERAVKLAFDCKNEYEFLISVEFMYYTEPIV